MNIMIKMNKIWLKCNPVMKMMIVTKVKLMRRMPKNQTNQMTRKSKNFDAYIVGATKH